MHRGVSFMRVSYPRCCTRRGGRGDIWYRCNQGGGFLGALTEFAAPAQATDVYFSQLPLGVSRVPGSDTVAVLAGFYQASRFQAFRNSHRFDLRTRERKELERLHAAALAARSQCPEIGDRPRVIESFVDPRAEKIATQ